MNTLHLSQVGCAKIGSLFLDLHLEKQLRVLYATVILSRVRPSVPLGRQFGWHEEQKQQHNPEFDHRRPPVQVKK
jgi:hypothetical protein